MKKLMQEFKEFALTGNVMDMAVGVILGAAIGKVVTALVNNILMPLIGIMLGGLDFSTLAITIGSASIEYGLFIQSIVDFLIIAFCVFLMVKGLRSLETKSKQLIGKKEEAKPEPAEEKTATTEELLAEIRDLLQQDATNQGTR